MLCLRAIAEGKSPQLAETPIGLVFNLMRFSLHDGPGIRTTVFLKGCPLRCWWCQNPEGLSPEPELFYWEERCIRCGECVRACPEKAIHLNGQVIVDTTLCRRCGHCAAACPAGARELVGRWMTVDEVVSEVLKDRVFFDESGGGITISGGEPLRQAAFVEALLAQCREKRIHTVMETSGFGDPRALRRISGNVDLFLYDIKLMDSERHRDCTGVKNDLILANLKMLAELGSQVIVRVPVIPGVNDRDEDLAALSHFLTSLRLRSIDLLPYHRMAFGKYQKLHLPYHLETVAPPKPEQMEALAARLTKDGFSVRIGG